MAGRMLREFSLPRHFGIEKTREFVARKYYSKGTRPAVATNTYPLLEGHQLRFDPRYCQLAYKDNAPGLSNTSSKDFSPSDLKSIGLRR